MMEIFMSVLFSMLLIFMNMSFWLFFVIINLIIFKFMLSNSFLSFYFLLSNWLGLDTMSYYMVLLSLWICSLMILASVNLYNQGFYWELFMIMIFLLIASLILTFSSMNLFLFYLFFELSLIPTLFLIIGWGVQPERISAGVYLLFYTMVASLPMLVAIFYLFSVFYTLEFYFFYSIDSSILYFSINMVFFVKLPMYLVHLWLPKAHVEAHISGSMILAGVLLKLGGYGLIRVVKIFSQFNFQLNMAVIVVSLVGASIVSLMCARQSDLKMLIAYSSVAHMGLVLSGIMSLNKWGFWGSFILMLAHGLCSSGLFCLANLSYERTHSRSIYLNKGLMNIMPNLSLWWFLLCSSNMAAPPSLNLLGEILLFNSLFMYSSALMFVLFFLTFYSAVYSLFLFSYTQHGQMYSGLYSFTQVNVREYLLLFLHWVPLNILVFKSECMVLFI
uniref:NADH-ubiquinone oxidoreductase chain 4 n=1 Tax=Trigonopterus sp. 4 AH-2016 TaxID=1903838 RepID=A0A343C419_9CUCU|nr:NADH dehydrogenase subunit 4 [Trigonopterus sp. 4 AH-2016]